MTGTPIPPKHVVWERASHSVGEQMEAVNDKRTWEILQPVVRSVLCDMDWLPKPNPYNMVREGLDTCETLLDNQIKRFTKLQAMRTTHPEDSI
jgi:hypothetical protein